MIMTSAAVVGWSGDIGGSLQQPLVATKLKDQGPCRQEQAAQWLQQFLGGGDRWVPASAGLAAQVLLPLNLPRRWKLDQGSRAAHQAVVDTFGGESAEAALIKEKVEKAIQDQRATFPHPCGVAESGEEDHSSWRQVGSIPWANR